MFWQLPGSCLPPQAQHFLRQLFLSRDFPPARRDLLFGIWTLLLTSSVTLEMVFKVCVSIPAWRLSELWRCAPAACLLDRDMRYKGMRPCTSVVPQPPGEGLEEEGMGTRRVERGVCPFGRVKGEESSPCSPRLV